MKNYPTDSGRDIKRQSNTINVYSCLAKFCWPTSLHYLLLVLPWKLVTEDKTKHIVTLNKIKDFLENKILCKHLWKYKYTSQHI